MKYIGLLGVITFFICLSFFESSGDGRFTNVVAEFISPFSALAVGWYLGDKIVRDFLED